MRLYTICIDQCPVVVMAVDAEPAFPDSLTTNTELLAARRRSCEMIEAAWRADPEGRTRMDQHEIDEALQTWLGQDLMAFGLWYGDGARINNREARVDEAEQWHRSRRAGIEDGDADPGSEDWVAFLVPVQDQKDDV